MAQGQDDPGSLYVCPACLEPGILSEPKEADSLRYYQCRRCRRVYPVGPFGVVDFQVVDKILGLPERYLGMWALTQSNAIEEYRVRSSSSVALPEREIVQSFSRFLELGGKTVLDIGSGLDYAPGYVAGVEMKRYVALDPLPVERQVPFERVQAWAECLPFADGAFDAVILGTSLDHLLCPESAFGEIHRVMKTGGRVFLWGAWFPDATFFVNVPEHRLFPRDGVEALGPDPSLAGFREMERAFQEVSRNSEALQERFGRFLVDKWHFRHFPLRFAKDLRKYGFRIEEFELSEWNYHENHLFLNGFLKLRKDGPQSDPQEALLLRHVDTMSLLAHVANQLIPNRPGAGAAAPGTPGAEIAEIRVRLDALAGKIDRALASTERIDNVLENIPASAGRALRRALRKSAAGPRRLAFRFWTTTGHDRLLALVCVRLAPVWRTVRRPRKSPPGKAVVCHATCSFDVGGTQRQIRNLCANGEAPRFSHVPTEIFPEQNFIFRQGEILRPSDYIKGHWIFRKLGRWVMDPGLRSMPIVQIYKLARDFQRLKPQIVVGWGHEMAMLAFAAAAFARVPKIVFCVRTWNPSFGWTPIPRLLQKAHKRMLPLLDGVIVNSSPLQKDYAAWAGISPGRIAICPNGIDAAALRDGVGKRIREETRGTLGIPPEALVILNVGRFSKEKGQMLLLRAYEAIVRKAPSDPPYLVLCGDGPVLSAAESFARARGLGRVRFPGRVPDSAPYFSAADIFVMPSDFEGLPNAMMEAMACGLPCVSTDRSGALDVARDGLEALYSPAGSEEQLEERLTRLILSPEERRRIGQNARKRLEEFTVERMTARFDGILARATARRF